MTVSSQTQRDAGSRPTPPAVPGLSPSQPVDEATVVVDGISKSFGSLTAVSDMSLTFGPGVTALLGPNGAGKSTLLRLMVGLEKPSTGTLRVVGGDPRASAEARGRIGLVPQQDGMFGRITAMETVHLGAVLANVDNPIERSRAALDAVELDPSIERPVQAFSKGMRQRVKVAQALVHDPDVILADEPLNGLDPRQRQHMISLFGELGAQGKTVIVSSHILEEVERFGSRVVVLAQGRLAASGDFREIRSMMDNRLAHVRLVVSDARSVGARLVAASLVSRVEVINDTTLEVRTADVRQFRVGLLSICNSLGATFSEITPMDDDLESVFRYLVARGSR